MIIHLFKNKCIQLHKVIYNKLLIYRMSSVPDDASNTHVEQEVKGGEDNVKY
jgi:hypothetical protein